MQYYFAGYRLNGDKTEQSLVITVRCESLKDIIEIAKILPGVRWTQGAFNGRVTVDIPSAI
jgi:hypothetical protein